MQLIVMPLLWEERKEGSQKKWVGRGWGGGNEGSFPLTCFTHTFVVIIWFFSS